MHVKMEESVSATQHMTRVDYLSSYECGVSVSDIAGVCVLSTDDTTPLPPSYHPTVPVVLLSVHILEHSVFALSVRTLFFLCKQNVFSLLIHVQCTLERGEAQLNV